MNKQSINKLTDTQNKLMLANRRDVGGVSKKGLKKYQLAITKQSQECKVQHEEHSNNIVITMYYV